MIDFQDIEGRRIAAWVGNGGFPPGKRTLVFIHGSGGDHTDWIRQYTPLKNAYPIAAIDLPGHGRSEGPGEREVAAYVEWVKKTLDALGIVRPVLIGRSLGAAICLSFAIRYGEKVSAVVPVGGGARMPVNPAILEGLRQDPALIVGLTARFSVAKRNRERFTELLTESLSRVDPETLHGDFSACDKLDIAETAAEIRIPALVLCGAEDKLTPPALSEDLRARIPGANLVLIEGTGHFVMLEDPDAFNKALTDFVNSLPQEDALRENAV